MPQIGWFEILIIVVLSILIIGPKDFPKMVKKIGNWVGSLKNYFSEVQKFLYGRKKERKFGIDFSLVPCTHFASF